MANVQTKADYEAYKQAVNHFMQVNNFLAVFHVDSDSYISSAMCSMCGCRSLGMRNPAAAHKKDIFEGKERFISIAIGPICDDCLYYATYNRLDDSTMLKIGE